jgi:transcription antitermination factor NusG
MPVLAKEPTTYPESLLAGPAALETDRIWRVLHTLPRQEKALTRQLLDREIPFYLPCVPRHNRIRGKRVTAYVPLFPSYVFILANPEERHSALTTRRVLRTLDVVDQPALWRDLRQVDRLLQSDSTITPEGRLGPGVAVEIRSGPLAGLRGKIVRSVSGRRFIVAVNFIQQGASVMLDDSVLVKAN